MADNVDPFADPFADDAPATGSKTGKQKLENFGETAPLKLQNFGETGETADPFADDAQVAETAAAAAAEEEDRTRDEAPADMYAVIGDQPEPDSKAPYTEGGSDSQATMDLEPTDLEALKTPSFVKDVPEGGGSEGLTMNEGKDVIAGDAPEDLREVSEPPPLDAEEAAAREAEETANEGEGGEGADGEATATLEHAEEEEPDFLYGERFSDRFQVPEGPPKKPSKIPQILAGVGGFALLGVIVFVIIKFSTGPREFQGVALPPVKTTTTAAAKPLPKLPPLPPRGGQLPAPPKPGQQPAAGPGGTPAPAAATQPRPDEPPPLPPPADAIDAKLRRALSWGLPIEPPKPAEGGPKPPQGGNK